MWVLDSLGSEVSCTAVFNVPCKIKSITCTRCTWCTPLILHYLCIRLAFDLVRHEYVLHLSGLLFHRVCKVSANWHSCTELDRVLGLCTLMS